MSAQAKALEWPAWRRPHRANGRRYAHRARGRREGICAGCDKPNGGEHAETCPYVVHGGDRWRAGVR